MLILHGKDIGMFRYLWLASLLLFGALIKGENTDSLRISIEKAVTEKGEIQALIVLSRYWTSKNSDSAVYYSKKLQQVALKA